MIENASYEWRMSKMDMQNIMTKLKKFSADEIATEYIMILSKE